MDFGLKLLDACAQTGDFIHLAFGLGRPHARGPLQRQLPRHLLLALGRDLVALRLTGRLAAALGVLTRGDVGNFPTCFEIAAHGTDGLVVDLGSLRDCPIGFLGRRLDQLGDQLALLLGGEMAATNVGADDIGIGIGAGLDLPARGCAADPILLP